ncbi:MAG: outer membrane beta-barrel protein [Sideroxydans sp.]|nr:outer membrane beta-barrel protein [Sideroxydans sp.]
MAAMLSMLMAGTAMAQEGKSEVSIAGNMTATTTDVGGFTSDATSTFFYFRMGQYLTSQMVMSGNVSLFGTSSNGGASSNVGTNLGFGLKYYLDGAAKSALVPFVEGELHMVLLSSTTSNITSTMTGGGLSAGVGASYFITEDVSADLSIQGFGDGLTDDYGTDITQSGVRMLFGLTARY